MTADEIYDGGYPALRDFLEERQRSFEGTDQVLPRADVVLAPLKSRLVVAPRLERLPRYSASAKWQDLQIQFDGAPELWCLHAMVIACLRRKGPPETARYLFMRIWEEEGQWMAETLNVRWLISAATTFADHGQTGDERALGMGLSVLFDMIKLHDSERRLTGLTGNDPFRRQGAGRVPGIAFGMQGYSFKGGDLDKVLLARLAQLADRTPRMRALAQTMLNLVMSERRSIFARVQMVKARRRGAQM